MPFLGKNGIIRERLGYVEPGEVYVGVDSALGHGRKLGRIRKEGYARDLKYQFYTSCFLLLFTQNSKHLEAKRESDVGCFPSIIGSPSSILRLALLFKVHSLFLREKPDLRAESACCSPGGIKPTLTCI